MCVCVYKSGDAQAESGGKWGTNELRETNELARNCFAWDGETFIHLKVELDLFLKIAF